MSVRVSPCSDADNICCCGPSRSFLYQRNDKRQNPVQSRKKGRGRAALLKLSHAQLVRGMGLSRLDKSVSAESPICVSASDCHDQYILSASVLDAFLAKSPVTMLPGAFVIMPPVASVPGASEIASGRIVLCWRATRAARRGARQAAGTGKRSPRLLFVALPAQLRRARRSPERAQSKSNARISA